jgi:hypothetical protein
MTSSTNPGTGPGSDDAERRSRLQAVKLRALVAEHLGAGSLPDDAVFGFAPGAGLVHEATAWVLLVEEPGRRLGAALAAAVRRGAERLEVITEADAGLLARRAAEFSFPIAVWAAAGRRLVPVGPEPVPVPPAPAAEHLALAELIRAGGATPVVEHGVVTGEVRGLEVCRVVDDPVDGTVELQVGVGVHDREAFRMIHGHLPTVDALAGVVEAVLARRRPGVAQHPLNRLGAERLLRWRLEQSPALVGAARLSPAEPPVPRPNVRDAMPCVATGVDADGAPVTVVCSSGVDLDLAPYAADARLAVAARSGVGTGGSGRTVVALPARDRLPLSEQLLGLLAQSVEIVSVD